MPNDLPTTEEFSGYCDSLETYIKHSTKQQLAKCAEALALKLAQYTLLYGDEEDDIGNYSREQTARWLIEGAYHFKETLAHIHCKTHQQEVLKDFLKERH